MSTLAARTQSRMYDASTEQGLAFALSQAQAQANGVVGDTYIFIVTKTTLNTPPSISELRQPSRRSQEQHSGRGSSPNPKGEKPSSGRNTGRDAAPESLI